ncbi:MAG: hypothetical protein ACOCVJ_02335 [Verrucomicrobiota bacterium]
MNAKDGKDLEAVAALFIRLGADEGRARVMAAQLLKRADQIAGARGISKLEATEKLLRQVVEARLGGGKGMN